MRKIMELLLTIGKITNATLLHRNVVLPHTVREYVVNE